MSEEINNTLNENGMEVKINNPRRRGITNETKAVTQLRFHENDAANNGLFIGHLADVKVDWSVATENSSFNGIRVPRLSFHFASQHTKVAEQRHVYKTLFPIASNVSTIPGGDSEWQVNNVLNWAKHILDVFYLKGRELTNEEEDALSLGFCDFDENGEYVMVEPQIVADAYGVLFTNVAAMLNGTFGSEPSNLPCYKDANGKAIPVWMKLLRHRRVKKGWINIESNGELGFDSFIGAGVIELFKGAGNPPAILRLDSAKESITPKETKKEPTLGTPGMPMIGGAIIADALPNAMPMNAGAFNAAGDGDMPF